MKSFFTASPASGAPNNANSAKRPGNKISIIIADDNQDDQELILKAIKTVDPVAEHAAVYNGAQLIDLLSNRGVYASSYRYRPNVIILDLNMPVMDGLTALKIIRGLAEYRQIPVFILHTVRNDDQLNQCSSLGVQGIFTKPSDFNALKIIVENIYYSGVGKRKEMNL